MKKLATYIMAGFLSVGIASPAFSDIDCPFVKEMVISGLEGNQNITVKLLLGQLSEERKETLKQVQRDELNAVNVYANVYSAFCK